MNNGKIKILIVEDEALIAMDIQEKLEDMGYEVAAVADNGIDALKYAGELNPDLILMDIVIKGDMDGIETAEKIKELYNIPSLFLTAYDNVSVTDRAMKTNPIGYLLKPFDDTKLQDVLIDLSVECSLLK